MADNFEKTKKEQERKRALWRERQKARMAETLSQKPLAKKAVKPIKELNQGRSPRAIMARLRATQAKERVTRKTAKEKALQALPGGEAAAKVRECRAGMNRLRNIYRIINGASGITLVGLIITFLVMNTQLFLGNIMKLKFIPGLSLPEILILLVVDFVVVIAILIIILFISVLIGAFVK